MATLGAMCDSLWPERVSTPLGTTPTCFKLLLVYICSRPDSQMMELLELSRCTRGSKKEENNDVLGVIAMSTEDWAEPPIVDIPGETHVIELSGSRSFS